MSRRSRREDDKPFYGCVTYPTCKGAMDIPSEMARVIVDLKEDGICVADAKVGLESRFNGPSIIDWDETDHYGRVYFMSVPLGLFRIVLPESEHSLFTGVLQENTSTKLMITRKLTRALPDKPPVLLYRVARMRALTTGKRALLRAMKPALDVRAYAGLKRLLDSEAGSGTLLGLIGLLGPFLPHYGANPHVIGLCDEFLAEGMAMGFNASLDVVIQALKPVIKDLAAQKQYRLPVGNSPKIEVDEEFDIEEELADGVHAGRCMSAT